MTGSPGGVTMAGKLDPSANKSRTPISPIPSSPLSQASPSLTGRSSPPKSPNSHPLPVSPPSQAFKVRASEQFDKSGLVAVQHAALHDAHVLEMGLHTLVVSNPEAKGAAFGEGGVVLEPPKVQDPPAGLKPILLKDMKTGKNHRGRVLFGTICTKPVKVRSLTTILEDDSGSATIVLIPHAVPVSCSISQAERQFPEGARVAIKNPYLKRFADNVVGILIEEPKEVIFLSIPEVHDAGPYSNGDNGELPKYNQDWERQAAAAAGAGAAAVGENHFSLENGDHRLSGSDEDDHELHPPVKETDLKKSIDKPLEDVKPSGNNTAGGPSAYEKLQGEESSALPPQDDKPISQVGAESAKSGERAEIVSSEAADRKAADKKAEESGAGLLQGSKPDKSGEGSVLETNLKKEEVAKADKHDSLVVTDLQNGTSLTGKTANGIVERSTTPGSLAASVHQVKEVADVAAESGVSERSVTAPGVKTAESTPGAAEHRDAPIADVAAEAVPSEKSVTAPGVSERSVTAPGVKTAESTPGAAEHRDAPVADVAAEAVPSEKSVTAPGVKPAEETPRAAEHGDVPKPAHSEVGAAETKAKGGSSSGDDFFEYDVKDRDIQIKAGSDPSEGSQEKDNGVLLQGEHPGSGAGKDKQPAFGSEKLGGEKNGGEKNGGEKNGGEKNGGEKIGDGKIGGEKLGEGKIGGEKPVSGTCDSESGLQKSEVVSVKHDASEAVADSELHVRSGQDATKKDTDVQGANALPKISATTDPVNGASILDEGSSKTVTASDGRKESLTLLSLQLNGGPATEGAVAAPPSATRASLQIPQAAEQQASKQVEKPAVTSPVIPANVSASALRVQGNRWFGQGEWKKSVTFYTWGIRQAIKEHRASISSTTEAKNGQSKKKNVPAALSDASPSGEGDSGKDHASTTPSRSNTAASSSHPDEEAVQVASSSESPRTYNEVLLGFSNRAEAWLRLQQYEKALVDSERALELDSQHLKSIFRKGRALLGLGEHQEALKLLQTTKDRAPFDKDLQEAFQACQVGDKQSRLGVFDLSDYFLSDRFSGGSLVPKCADYVGPVEIQHVGEEKGHGLILTRDVEAGSLLLVSNPLVFASDIEVSSGSDAQGQGQGNSPFSGSSEGRIAPKIREQLLTALQTQLELSTRSVERLLSLSHENVAVADSGNVEEDSSDGKKPSLSVFAPAGKAYTSAYASAEQKLVLQEQLDSGRVSRIIHHNAFDRSTLRIQVGGGEQDDGPDTWEEIVDGEDSLDHGTVEEEQQQRDEQFCGIWSLPSYINHSCVPNTSWVLVGKTLFVVASRDLVAGEEITFNYFNIFQPLAERRKVSTSAWQFTCNCPRCLLEERLDSHLEKVKKASDVLTELEQLLATSLKDLTPQERNWLRASFVRSYLRQLGEHQRNEGESKQVKLTPEALTYLPQCLEAMDTVCPGSLETLRMSVVAREVAKHSSGKKSARYRSANSVALRICRCTYGKQKANVLQALVSESRESLARFYNML